MKKSKLLKFIAKRLGAPLAAKNSESVIAVRKVYAEIRAGAPFGVLSSLALPEPEAGVLAELIDEIRPKFQQSKLALKAGYNPEAPVFKKYVPPPQTGPECSICGAFLLPFELDPPMCVWCEKQEDLKDSVIAACLEKEKQ